jgi:L-lactate dehydrogenase complex protein LldE
VKEVDLFIPCFIDQFYPDTAFAVIKLLERAGCKVNYNPGQTCCGQPAFNSGYWKEAQTIAKKFLNDFKGSNPIIAPSASCTGYISNYFPDLFKEEMPWFQEYCNVKGRLVELTDFLVNHLGFMDFQAEFPHTVTYHDACAALREYGIKDQPRQLLSKVRGLTLVEMEETDTCCGFGGTFVMKFKAISSAMTAQKVEHALNTGAEYIVSTEASCLMNIQTYTSNNAIPVKPIHIADVLAAGW